jgi:hypothetical protein
MEEEEHMGCGIMKGDQMDTSLEKYIRIWLQNLNGKFHLEDIGLDVGVT